MTILLPLDFIVPELLVTENFRFEVLAPEVCSLDYDAVMSSKDRLKTVFGIETSWPRDDLTLSDNLADLKMHQQEFKKREAFAYTILTPNRDRALGAVYIDPSRVIEYCCEVQFWLRNDSLDLDAKLYATIINWISNDWPFKRVAYPGRSVNWTAWHSLVKKANTKRIN